MKFTALLFASLLAVASAHEVWIEDTPDGQLVVRFAEFGDDYEKSPGHLDALDQPRAFAFSPEGKAGVLDVKKLADGFALAGASPKTSAFAEAGFQVMGGGDKAARRPIFYARWHVPGAKAAEPALNFDLVPTANAGEARVTFRGKPLPGVKVTAYLADGSEQELTADAEGLVRVTATKPGLYLIAGKHQREDQAGFANGKAYAAVSHNCSLAWRQP